MLKIKLFTFLVLLSFCEKIFGQEKAIVIPFQLTEYNNIAVQAILNEKDTVSLMFHTAASSVTLTEDAVKKLTSLTFTAVTDGVKSWGGETNAARLSENNSLQIGAMQFKGISIWENKYSGQKTDGKFGIDLFKDHVILLDFEKNRLTITSALPKDIHNYEKLKLVVENDMMFLEAGCKTDTTVFKNKFLIHSGYSGAILFDDKFAGDHKLGETLKITGEKELKDSYGNTLKTIKAVLPVLKIGTVELYNVPVGFFSGALGTQKMSVLGGDILKRFQVIIDSKRAYIYLKSNKLKKEKYTNH